MKRTHICDQYSVKLLQYATSQLFASKEVCLLKCSISRL